MTKFHGQCVHGICLLDALPGVTMCARHYSAPGEWPTATPASPEPHPLCPHCDGKGWYVVVRPRMSDGEPEQVQEQCRCSDTAPPASPGAGELTQRIEESQARIGRMCHEGRPPKMSIPVRDSDDDVYITGTLVMCAAAITALREERDLHVRLSEDLKMALEPTPGLVNYVEWAKECRAAVDELAASKEDAARYRWLRVHPVWQVEQLPNEHELLDAAIDAAIAQEPRK